MKIYGYKSADIDGFLEFYKQNKGKPLTKMFKEYGKIIGKSQGTIRNMYYKIVKQNGDNALILKEKLNGEELKTEKFICFDKQEEEKLLKKILIEKDKGRSVRSTVMELANGDGKVALRYQNKYRNICAHNKPLVERCLKELFDSGEIDKGKLPPINPIAEINVKRLQKEINDLFLRVSSDLKRENKSLKEKLMETTTENERLKSLIFGKSAKDVAFFMPKKDETLPS